MSRESSAHEERVTRNGVSRFAEDSPGGPVSMIKWKISSQDPGHNSSRIRANGVDWVVV